MSYRWQLWLKSFLFFSAQMLASAATFVLEPEADLRILGIIGYEDQNQPREILSVYTQPDNVQRTLIRFDFSNVFPQGQPVTSAILSLVASTQFGGSKGQPTEVYRATAPWKENMATWRIRETDTPWQEPGGEYVGQSGVSDVAPYASNSETPIHGQTLSWNITGLVNAWIEGTVPNYGLLLRSYEGNGLTFVQREWPDAGLHPKLTLALSTLPPLLAERTADGQVAISWEGENVGLLEQNTAWPGSGWTPTASPIFSNGRSGVTIPAAGAASFFRLRSF